jgi:hypothetical protein
MKAGDLVKVKSRYSDCDYGYGVFLGLRDKNGHRSVCRVLFSNVVLIFHRCEIEVAS